MLTSKIYQESLEKSCLSALNSHPKYDVVKISWVERLAPAFLTAVFGLHEYAHITDSLLPVPDQPSCTEVNTF